MHVCLVSSYLRLQHRIGGWIDEWMDIKILSVVDHVIFSHENKRLHAEDKTLNGEVFF